MDSAADSDKKQRRRPSLGAEAVISAAVVAAGDRLGGAVGAGAAAFGLPFALDWIEKVRDEWRADQRLNVSAMAAAAADEAGWTADELGEHMRWSPDTRLLTATAAESAARTAWPRKVVALGKVLAAGLIADGDAVLMPQYALNAMTELERLDVSLLDLLVRYWPSMAIGETTPGFLPLGTCLDHDQSWTVGPRHWREDLIVLVRPELGPVLPTVTGTLARHGLATQADRTRELLEMVNQQLPGQLMLSQQRQERTWDPTYLGELVLSYYLDAGEQDDPAALET